MNEKLYFISDLGRELTYLSSNEKNKATLHYFKLYYELKNSQDFLFESYIVNNIDKLETDLNYYLKKTEYEELLYNKLTKLFNYYTRKEKELNTEQVVNSLYRVITITYILQSSIKSNLAINNRQIKSKATKRVNKLSIILRELNYIIELSNQMNLIEKLLNKKGTCEKIKELQR